MKVNPFVSLCSILTASVAAGLDIETVVGDGCKNKINYSYSFYTDNGDSCEGCKLCSGTRIGLLFDPDHKNFCIECEEAKQQCTTLNVVTSFKTAWTMKFFSLISSDMITDNTDPAGVVLHGSIDGKTWATLLSADDSSGSLFKKRMVKQTYMLDNNNKYSHYFIEYKLNKASTTMHLGTSDILQAYIKECAAQKYSDVTGLNMLPYNTLSENLALSGTASSSSMYQYKNRYGMQTHPASAAIDGHTEGKMFHSKEDYKAWWKVKLSGYARIFKIVVWNRRDHWGKRLSNAEVKIYNGSDLVVKKTIGNANFVKKFEFEYDGVVGDSVMVQLTRRDFLNLYEVQVYGFYKNG